MSEKPDPHDKFVCQKHGLFKPCNDCATEREHAAYLRGLEDAEKICIEAGNKMQDQAATSVGERRFRLRGAVFVCDAVAAEIRLKAKEARGK